MKWGPTPTDWYTDLALDEAGERAEILHRRAWDLACHQETGGFISASMAARLCPTHTKARIAALLAVGKWVDVEGGYQLAEWEGVFEDFKSLMHRRKSDVERQRRHRAKKAADGGSREPSEEPTRDATADASRSPSRDSHGVDKRRDNPPTPRQAGGDCDPISKPHPHCRGCGTSRRAIARADADADAQADAERREAAKNAPWCGKCDPNGRWLTTTTGDKRCPDCNEVELLKRGTRPALAVIGASA